MEISHCVDSLDNVSILLYWISLSLCWRRAIICCIASTIGVKNSAWKCCQHGLIGWSLRSHIVQTVSKVHFHHCLGWTSHHPGGAQQSVELLPQLMPETQLQIDINMALKWSSKISLCSDSFDNVLTPPRRAAGVLFLRRRKICGKASWIAVWYSTSNGNQSCEITKVLTSHRTLPISSCHQ